MKNWFLWTLFVSCLFFLLSCRSAHTIIRYDDKLILADSTLNPDSAIQAHIAPYAKEVHKEMDKVIAFSEQVLMKEQPEGLLGDLITDIILKRAVPCCKDSCKIDFCVLNNSGFVNYLPKGTITKGNVASLFPFEDELVLLTLNGQEVKELLDFIANKGGMPLSGIRMKIRNGMSADVLIQDVPFDIARSYTLVTTRYLASGGEGMRFLLKAVQRYSFHANIKDIVLDYLSDETKKGNTILVKKDERIQAVK